MSGYLVDHVFAVHGPLARIRRLEDGQRHLPLPLLLAQRLAHDLTAPRDLDLSRGLRVGVDGEGRLGGDLAEGHGVLLVANSGGLGGTRPFSRFELVLPVRFAAEGEVLGVGGGVGGGRDGLGFGGGVVLWVK